MVTALVDPLCATKTGDECPPARAAHFVGGPPRYAAVCARIVTIGDTRLFIGRDGQTASRSTKNDQAHGLLGPPAKR